MVDDGDTFHRRGRGRDRDVGGGRSRHHRGYSHTLLNGDIHRLQAPVRKDFHCSRLIGHRRTDRSFFSRKKDALKKRKLKLRMPPISRARKSEKEDVKSLASDMCPNGASDGDFRTRSAVV